MADVTPGLLRAFLVHLQDRNLSAHTIHGYARALRTRLYFCVHEELLATQVAPAKTTTWGFQSPARS